jgi:hypothetical protein
MLNSLEIRIGGGFGVTTFYGNLRNGLGTFSIEGIDQFGTAFPATLGPLTGGVNNFTLRATGDELITEVMITAAAGSPAHWRRRGHSRALYMGPDGGRLHGPRLSRLSFDPRQGLGRRLEPGVESARRGPPSGGFLRFGRDETAS